MLDSGDDSSANYLAVSRIHHWQCTALLSEALNIPNPTDEMLEVMAWTNNMLCIYTLALPPPTSSESELDKWGSTVNLLDWVQSTRTFTQNNTRYWSQAMSRQTESLAQLSEQMINPLSAEWLTSRLSYPEILSTIHLPFPTTPEPEELLVPGVSEVYRQTVSRLRDAYAFSLLPTHQWSSVLLWTNLMPPEFSDYITEKRPRALIILSYYCALISQFKYLWCVSRSVLPHYTIH